jgi:hypothetical protein
MLRIACKACGRRGQYRIDLLLDRFGPDIALPDLRHELALCRRRGSISEPAKSVMSIRSMERNDG